MKRIGIIPNLLKDINLKVTKQVVQWLNTNGFQCFVATHIAKKLTVPCETMEEEELYYVCEAMIAIGGDGTILGIAQKSSMYNLPIIGINLGRLGFLADVEIGVVDEYLSKLLTGDYHIEERMMLSVKIIEPTGEVHRYSALNDVSITRGNASRITEFELAVNSVFLDIYAADGIVVSTPTGSTGYSLSAGGPIVSPAAKIMLITPICPHTIYSRSVVLAETDKVQVKTHNFNGNILELAVDGQTKVYVTPAHQIEIEKAAYTTKLVKLSDLHFFEILRKKIVERRPRTWE
ncbi:MAG: NAD(+)/NADH kinase [Cellulosilyticaceae bacterium]